LNKVLILAKGNEAKNFLNSIVDNYMNVAEFDVVYQNDSDILDKFRIDGINLYKIPFGSFVDLGYFRSKEYSKIIIIIKNKTFALKALEAIEYFRNQNIIIDFVDFWGLDIHEKNVSVISLPSIINLSLIDLLPNVPIFARNIGLGEEEIMEVQVPVSSPFVYRNIDLLNARNSTRWRIVAIYRDSKLILPNKMSTIQAYDNLIIIGKPNVLKDVYKNIKKDVGLFPAPYGNNIYLLIDKQVMSQKETSKLLKAAIHLQKKIKSKKLIIKIINPNLHRFDKLRKFDNIEIYIDYHNTKAQKVFEQDLLRFNIGIFVVNNKFYEQNLDFLLKFKKPFLKIGDKESIKKCQTTALLLSDTEEVAEISPVVFDLSSQLETKLQLLDIDPNNIKLDQKEIVKYYENLVKMYYYKNAEFVIKNDNPYFEIKQMKNVCFFVPFNKNIPKSKFLSYFLPNTAKVALLLDNFNQFMIPTKDKI